MEAVKGSGEETLTAAAAGLDYLFEAGVWVCCQTGSQGVHL